MKILSEQSAIESLDTLKTYNRDGKDMPIDFE